MKFKQRLPLSLTHTHTACQCYIPYYHAEPKGSKNVKILNS